MPEFFSNIWEGYRTIHWFWWGLPGWILAVLVILDSTVDCTSYQKVARRLIAITISIASYWYGGYLLAVLFWSSILAIIIAFICLVAIFLVEPAWKCLVIFVSWLLLPEDWKIKAITSFFVKATKMVLPKKS